MVECQLPKLNVEGSSPFTRFPIIHLIAWLLAILIVGPSSCVTLESYDHVVSG